MPLVNSFVEVAVNGERRRQSICVDDIAGSALITRPLAGLAPGMTADFVYTNGHGKFRFVTRCVSVDAAAAYFEIPETIRTIESFSERRTAERVPLVVPVQWRYAPDGVGFGDFLTGSMMDVSRGGASLVVGRELKVGAQVEVRFALKAKGEPFVEVGQVVRAAKIETSDKNAAGVRFTEIDGDDERILDEFVRARRALRRDRGVI